MPQSIHYSLSIDTDSTPLMELEGLLGNHPEIVEISLRSKPVDNVFLAIDSIMTNLGHLEDRLVDASLITIMHMNPKYKTLLAFLPDDTFITPDMAKEWELDELPFDDDEMFRIWLYTDVSVELDEETGEQFPPTIDRSIGLVTAYIEDSADSVRVLH